MAATLRPVPFPITTEFYGFYSPDGMLLSDFDGMMADVSEPGVGAVVGGNVDRSMDELPSMPPPPVLSKTTKPVPLNPLE